MTLFTLKQICEDCNVKPKAKKPGKKYKEDVDEYTIKGINA